jgi:hypothetical protein
MNELLRKVFNDEKAKLLVEYGVQLDGVNRVHKLVMRTMGRGGNKPSPGIWHLWSKVQVLSSQHQKRLNFYSQKRGNPAPSREYL